MTAAPTIAAFGDSLFEGWGLANGQDAPSVLQHLLHENGLAARMLNFGISGETAGEGLRRLGRVLAAKPDIALLEFGANDFYQGVDPARMEEQLAAMLTALQQENIAVILVGVRCLPEYTGEQYAAQFAPVHARLAARFNVPLVPDIFASYLHDPALVQADGIHPNNAGAKAIARLLLPCVLDLLGKAA